MIQGMYTVCHMVRICGAPQIREYLAIYHIYTYSVSLWYGFLECRPASNQLVPCQPFRIAGSCISTYEQLCTSLVCAPCSLQAEWMGITGQQMTAMGWKFIPGNDIAGFYWSPSCQYIGVGVAGISELELPVYRSPNIPEHPNMPNPGTPGTHCQKSVIN